LKQARRIGAGTPTRANDHRLSAPDSLYIPMYITWMMANSTPTLALFRGSGSHCWFAERNTLCDQCKHPDVHSQQLPSRQLASAFSVARQGELVGFVPVRAPEMPCGKTCIITTVQTIVMRKAAI